MAKSLLWNITHTRTRRMMKMNNFLKIFKGLTNQFDLPKLLIMAYNFLMDVMETY